MNAVEKLESKYQTSQLNREIAISPEKEDGSFISGDLGVSARVSFRLNSPWKAIGAWIRRLAA